MGVFYFFFRKDFPMNKTLPVIFKKPDYSHIETEARALAENVSLQADAIPSAAPPDFSYLSSFSPDDPMFSGEEKLQLHLNLAVLQDRAEYAKACYNAMEITASGKNSNVQALAAAACRFAGAYSQFRASFLVGEFSADLFKLRHHLKAMRKKIHALRISSAGNPALKDHVETLKDIVSDLRSQIKDKEALLEATREKLEATKQSLKSAKNEVKRSKRTNTEVSKIILEATKGKKYCIPLRWSESTISRLNSSCVGAKPGQYGYPGNNASRDRLERWAVDYAMQRKKQMDNLADTQDEREEKRFKKEGIVYLPPDKIDNIAEKAQQPSFQYFDEVKGNGS